MGRVLTIAFYAVMLGAVGFFLHKVLWFFRYRRLQEKLVTRALGKLTEEADTTVVRWDQGAEVSWAEASAGDSFAPSPTPISMCLIVVLPVFFRAAGGIVTQR